ncbi:MarR family winged helix-turn-helix transcriptional regulator [Pediococcus siamensis]|uniref:MarR family winged helix-turn-helix transcriptional regulator n=1 Tax=Pediococcus siamensis TaxID=381829 RepID=UPI0039A0E0AD
MENYQQQLTQLSQLAYQSDQLYRTWARQNGVNFHQLITLYELYNQGQCTQKDIISIWRVPKQTLHTICERFVKTDMIVFLPANADKRERLMTLTPTGRKFAEPLVTKLVALENTMTAQLKPGALKQAIATVSQFNSLFTAALEH